MKILETNILSMDFRKLIKLNGIQVFFLNINDFGIIAL